MNFSSLRLFLLCISRVEERRLGILFQETVHRHNKNRVVTGISGKKLDTTPAYTKSMLVANVGILKTRRNGVDLPQGLLHISGSEFHNFTNKVRHKRYGFLVSCEVVYTGY